MRQATFRAIFAGLVITDRFAGQSAPAAADQPLQWQTLLLDMTQSRAAQDLPLGQVESTAFRQAEAESLAGCLLSALPVLLLNIDRYGHRQASISKWGAELGLSQSTVAALTGLFLYLCQVHDNCCLPRLGVPTPITSPATASTAFQAVPCLQDAYGLAQQVQGNFVLGLEVARTWGWSTAHMGLVSLFTTLQGGLSSIPSSQLGGHFSASAETSGGGWSTAEQQALLQAGSMFYARWSGVYKPGHDQRHSAPAAVTI